MPTPSKEGSTKKYASGNISSPIDQSNPFSVSLVERTADNSLEGSIAPVENEVGFSFVQAYVVNYGRQQQEGSEEIDPTNVNERMVWIENMDKVFEMDYNETNPIRTIYEVNIQIGDDGNVKRACLCRKPKTGEEGYREDPTKDTVEDGEIFIPVCEVINQNVTKTWLRDNIHWGNVAGGDGCQPWVPKFINSGTEEAPSWSYKFNFGTVNGIVPYNYYSENTVSSAIATGAVEGFIVLKVSTSGNKVVDVEYTLETSPDQGSDVDPIQVGAAPAALSINAGSVCGCGEYCIIYGGNINAEIYCAFTQTSGNFINGSENFDRWYKYKVY